MGDGAVKTDNLEKMRGAPKGTPPTVTSAVGSLYLRTVFSSKSGSASSSSLV